MNDRLAILADDLTGAADTGAAFAAAGLSTAVLLSPSAPIPPDADVLVMTSESRHLSPDGATTATRHCMTRIADWCGGDTTTRVYTKIDSTLRGHPARTLAAVMDALGVRGALVAPAFPAQGRTTLHGRQCVQGVPLEATSFGREVATADLATLFRAGAPEQIARLSRNDLRHGVDHVAGLLADTHRMWIADAVDDADLAILAAAAIASPLRMLCGSAGLARALAHGPAQGPAARRRPPEGRRPHDEGRSGDERRGAVLVVAGSRHAATAAQVEALRRDVLVVEPERSWIERDDAQDMTNTVTRLAEALAGRQPVVLSTTTLPDATADRMAVAARLAVIVAEVAARVPLAGLVLTGGDTAAAVCDALGSASLWLTGELQPGIATATLIGGQHQDLPIVTKAGGFGDDAALGRAAAFLDSGNSKFDM